MSYKVKVKKKTIRKDVKPTKESYWGCPECGYYDDIGGFCPCCHDVEMDFVYPEKYGSFAEYLLGTVEDKL